MSGGGVVAESRETVAVLIKAQIDTGTARDVQPNSAGGPLVFV
jgi:hypothetical protein